MPLKPDSGLAQVTLAKVVAVIGGLKQPLGLITINPLCYLLILVLLEELRKPVTGRGVGLPSIQAMALAHGEGVIEIACNLLDPNKIGGDRVQREVELLAREEGIYLGRGYFTCFSQEEIVLSYLKLS